MPACSRSFPGTVGGREGNMHSCLPACEVAQSLHLMFFNICIVLQASNWYGLLTLWVSICSSS